MSKKKKCPLCARKFHTRSAMRLHLWAEGIAAETSRPVDEVEAQLKRFRDEGLLRIDPRDGGLVGKWSRMGDLGQDILAVLGGIEEEDRQAKEERRQARRESLGIEQEEAAS
jgi:hypothetical protein